MQATDTLDKFSIGHLEAWADRHCYGYQETEDFLDFVCTSDPLDIARWMALGWSSAFRAFQMREVAK